jgi:hypothetical protein
VATLSGDDEPLAVDELTLQEQLTVALGGHARVTRFLRSAHARGLLSSLDAAWRKVTAGEFRLVGADQLIRSDGTHLDGAVVEASRLEPTHIAATSEYQPQHQRDAAECNPPRYSSFWYHANSVTFDL